MFLLICLNRHYIVCARTFLALANFKLNFLTVIKCCVIIATFNFRMMDEKIFSAICRRNKTIALSGVEPLNCTFAHICSHKKIGELLLNLEFEFTVSN